MEDYLPGAHTGEVGGEDGGGRHVRELPGAHTGEVGGEDGGGRHVRERWRTTRGR